MHTILSMRHGSHLYGTATPNSDLDIKEVCIPPARDILLGRVKRSVNRKTKDYGLGGTSRKNTAEDVDTEIYSLDKFIALFTEGQTVAIDMLFATPLLGYLHDGVSSIGAGDELGAYTSIWAELWENRERLMSKRADAFLGYAMKQASKYGIRGSRVAAAREIVAFLDQKIAAFGPQAKLGDFAFPGLEMFVLTHEHSELLDVEIGSQGKTIRHLCVCGRKAPFTITLKEAHAIYKRIYDEYGERARQAERNEGVDWKALSHAVRVGTQSIEYLATGFVTFPRPDRAHLLEIKRGELPYAKVAEEIENLLVQVEEAAKASTLPEKADYKWCDDFIVRVYGEEVRHFQ